MNLTTKLGSGNYHRIAKRAQLAPNHVSRVLRGQRGVSFDVAYRIAKAAGVSLDDLHTWVASRPGYRYRGRKTRLEIRLLSIGA